MILDQLQQIFLIAHHARCIRIQNRFRAIADQTYQWQVFHQTDLLRQAQRQLTRTDNQVFSLLRERW
jgi:hypothetical protein